MRYFVQYHNPDLMGSYRPSKSGFGVLTNKFIEPVHGDSVWLVTGSGKPRRYSLCSWFVVSGVRSVDGGIFRKQVLGSEGRDFKPFIPLDTMPWFRELLKKSGNFGLGLHRIKSKAVIECLE
jgi:hypothetical protein